MERSLADGRLLALGSFKRGGHHPAEGVLRKIVSSQTQAPPPKSAVHIRRPCALDLLPLRPDHRIEQRLQPPRTVSRLLQVLDERLVYIQWLVQAQSGAARHVGNGESLVQRARAERTQEVRFPAAVIR
ncbi:MAG: hypothetical protein OXH69_00295 [Acidobacteria bacterium]|nr:hypothetical protein [Acidobacteriota bacterium]